MAEPPAVVAQTFKPQAGLQLHRLVERARFHCLHCQQDTTSTHVATMSGDWARTLCGNCYGILVRAAQERAMFAAQARGRSGQARPHLVGGVNRQPPTENPPAQLSKRERRLKKERQQLERRLPGIDRLLAFFGDAGIPVRLVDGCLRINGSQTRPLAWILPARETLDWDSVIDEMAVKYVGDKFRRAVAKNARFGGGIRAFMRPGDRGIAIMLGEVQLALIHATSAQVPHCDVIYGNFLKPGPHWSEMVNGIHSVEEELVNEWKQKHEARAAAAASATKSNQSHVTARRRLDRLPNSLAPGLLAACLHASQRIRLERQVAYERPVVLESDFGELTVLPIAGPMTRLLIPFRLNTGTEALQGELILGDRDPLPLLVGVGVADEDAITAWTCALLGIADVTCIEFEPPEPSRRPKVATPLRPVLPSLPPPRPSARSLPRKRWPKRLEPVGRWIQYSGAFVAGHRRRLNEGRTASIEAHDRARQVGISLQPHETWVRPHTRGIPDGIEMRFRWHAPSELLVRAHNP